MGRLSDTDYERAGDLFDYAVDKPNGFTRYEAMEEFDWTLSQCGRATRALRLTLDDDVITLPCEAQGEREPWLYRLVGTYEDAQPWSAGRLADAEARLETLEAVSRSIVNGADGRTVEGKKARLILSVVTFLREQLQMMEL